MDSKKRDYHGRSVRSYVQEGRTGRFGALVEEVEGLERVKGSEGSEGLVRVKGWRGG